MTPMFSINKEQLKKAGVKLILVILGGVATYFETYIPGVLEVVVNNPIILTVFISVNTGLVDFLRKFISDEEGKLGGIQIA